MHIAYYSPAWPPAHAANGIVTYVCQMKNALEKRGHRVTIFTSQEIFTAAGEKIEFSLRKQNRFLRLLKRFFPFTKWHVAEGKRLGTAFSKHCTDVDLLEMEESFGIVHALQNTLSVPVVVRLHGPNFRCAIEKLEGRAFIESQERTRNEGVAIKSARYLTAPSANILKDVLKYYKASPAIATAVYNPAPEYDGELWRYKNSNRFEILHVGRFDRLKGADLMVRAFCLIADKYADARLILIGPDRGLQVETGELLHFNDYSQRYVPEDLRHKIIFLGHQEQSQINEFRLRSHVTVIPSRFEVLPYSALETLAAGTPLICADGIADDALVIDGETGWDFKNGSAESLADSITRAFECGADIQRVASAGRHHCISTFGSEVIGPKMMNFYETVLTDHQPG